MAERKTQLLVIGGGPGGYVAAMKAAMLGLEVTLVERDRVGGTCLNRGCIPTKAVLHSAELYHQMKNSADTGVTAENVKLDLAQVDRHKQKIVDTLVKGVEGLLRARKVTLVPGEASFVSPDTVAVQKADGSIEKISAGKIIIAAGSKPSAPPIPGIGGKNVITSTEALQVGELPESMIIIGGGVIGMEIGAAYSRFGVKITVIEALDRILPPVDAEISAEYVKQIRGQMEIHTGSRVEKISDRDGKKIVEYSSGGKKFEASADKVLVCIGRLPDTDSLHLERAGVKTERGAVIIDEEFRTNVPGIWCIGDANAKCMLAHAASAQGIAVAERLAGKKSGMRLDLVPSCIYTDPEIASVGMTEEQAKEAGIDYNVGRFPFRGNGRALILGKAAGFVKIIGDKKYGEILGVHIIGPNATELIAECAAAMHLEACVEDIAETIHAHPTVSEAVMEAAESFLGGAIHMV